MPGYYRYPTVFEDFIVFSSEDDLWRVALKGGRAERLSAHLAHNSHPIFSPDGKKIAFIGREEGSAEVYVMDSDGSDARRLTFTGSLITAPLAWKDENTLIFASSYREPHKRMTLSYEVSVEGSTPREYNAGPCSDISFSPNKGSIIGRNTGGVSYRNPSWWKRYRGGTAGVFWIDRKGDGNFERFLEDIDGNLDSPMWIGDRIYFLSDHAGIGNLYSVNLDGSDIKQHNQQTEYYCRQASSDQKTIVFSAGGDIYRHDIASDKTEVLKIDYFSSYTQRQRKFSNGEKEGLSHYDLSPDAKKLVVSTRGKIFHAYNWEFGALQSGKKQGVHYKTPCWLHDGEHFVCFGDENNEEQLMLFHSESSEAVEIFDKLDTGLVYELKSSPREKKVAWINHRSELCLADLNKKTQEIVAKSPCTWGINGFSWSPDGRFIAYAQQITEHQSEVQIYSLEEKKSYCVSSGDFFDQAPEFDTEGRYLFFISSRNFDPVYDNNYWEASFPYGFRPFVLTLKAETPSLFVRQPAKDEDEEEEENESEDKKDKDNKKEKEDEVPKIEIDFDGIENRLEAFPVSWQMQNYSQIVSTKDYVFFSKSSVSGSLHINGFEEEDESMSLEAWNIKEYKVEGVSESVVDIASGHDNEHVIYSDGSDLRVIKASALVGSDSKESDNPYTPKEGWIDQARFRFELDPAEEWAQIFKEAWRLQKEYFWSENMSGIDWSQIYKRYYPLLERLGSRQELSDLIWEMHGELGTSHAYIMNGDFRKSPSYNMGFLGVDLVWDEKEKAYKIEALHKGDEWESDRRSPLLRPGVNAKVGEFISHINGQKLSSTQDPHACLINMAQQEIEIRLFEEGKAKEARSVFVKALKNENELQYREWVEKKRRWVHKQSKGRVGYVHIPNMGPRGYSEFHRYFAAESEKDALLVDVRFNGGGNVSQLILEKLARKPIAYTGSRWSKEPRPYPNNSVRGPMLCLTNEHAGSDGDIFSHNFKQMKLGKLVGKRTWGGVIGIWPRHRLVDGSVTTQPEFSYWFKDVGWAVENYGTDPDVEVDIAPQDYANDKDPQLEKSVEILLEDLKANPPVKPNMENRPNLAFPQ